jgi:hypothetical protein
MRLPEGWREGARDTWIHNDARACSVPQPRLSAAREAGKGRALSKPQRARLSQEIL